MFVPRSRNQREGSGTRQEQNCLQWGEQHFNICQATWSNHRLDKQPAGVGQPHNHIQGIKLRKICNTLTKCSALQFKPIEAVLGCNAIHVCL